MSAPDAATSSAHAKRRRLPRPKTFCEFFAGIGLVREGLGPSGWQCLFANDIAPEKVRMYEARFGAGGACRLGDVRDTEAVVSDIRGAPLLATASFPCTDLSLAGRRRGLRGTQSSAFFGFVNALRALAAHRPPLVLIENVPGFITANGGREFAPALRAIAKLGYWIDAFVVDAKYFVPQSRPRVFIVGLRRRALAAVAPARSSPDAV